MEQIAAALVAFILGLWGYYHRLELERRRSSYITDGVDRLVDDAEYALSVYAQNWQLALRALKTFREIPSFLAEDFLGQFIEVDQTRMKVTGPRNVANIIGDNCPWEFYQLCFSFSGTRSQIIIHEILPALASNRESNEDRRLEICSLAENELLKMHDEYHRLYAGLNLILDFKDELENVRFFSKSEIRDFKLKRNIRATSCELRKVVKESRTESDSAAPAA